jgi:hypothetical protein
MHSITYVSSATVEFPPEALRLLLEVARSHNEAAQVTGMLLYHQGSFMQVIEGPAEGVREIHQRIVEDGRHRGMITLLQEHIDARHFPKWSMGFRDLTRAGPIEGFSEILNGTLTGREFADNPSKAQRLLLSFKKHI